MASAIGAFPYKKKLTIKTDTGGAALGGSLTDFPVCVVVNSDSWTTQAERDLFFSGNNNTAGKRVQFFASDGTTNLAYEVESFTASTSAIYWVKVGSLSKSDTANYIYVAYGSDPNGANQDQASSVWDSNFKGVWHLGGNSWAGSAPEAVDSTSNANSATDTGGSSDAAGLVGRGRSFNGTTNYLELTTNSTLNPTTLTLEAVVYAADYATQVFVSKYSNVPCQYELLSGSDRKLYFRVDNSVNSGQYAVGSAAVTDGNTYYLAGTRDTAVKLQLYQDGVKQTDSGTFTAGTRTADNLIFGCRRGTFAYAKANTLDEVRLSNVVRSADWIKATHFSMKKTTWNGDGWLAWSAAEAQWPPQQPRISRQAVQRAATR